ENLGAEVLAPVRPADTAARDATAAQMHRLDARAVDGYLDQRARQRQLVERARIELEGEERLPLILCSALEEIGAQRRLDDVEVAAQDAVLVEVGAPVEAALDLRDDRGSPLIRTLLVGRIEQGAEQLDQHAGDRRVARQRLLHIGLAEGDGGLAQILAVGAQ